VKVNELVGWVDEGCVCVRPHDLYELQQVAGLRSLSPAYSEVRVPTGRAVRSAGNVVHYSPSSYLPNQTRRG
jgi:hypothetical protein